MQIASKMHREINEWLQNLERPPKRKFDFYSNDGSRIKQNGKWEAGDGGFGVNAITTSQLDSIDDTLHGFPRRLKPSRRQSTSFAHDTRLLLGFGLRRWNRKPSIGSAGSYRVLCLGRIGIHHIDREWTLQHHFQRSSLVNADILSASE
jgi:hypothetical protein